MSNEVSTPRLVELQARLRQMVTAKIIPQFGLETTGGVLLQLTTAVLAVNKNPAELAQFLRALADEVESCEKPIDPIELN